MIVLLSEDLQETDQIPSLADKHFLLEKVSDTVIGTGKDLMFS